MAVIREMVRLFFASLDHFAERFKVWAEDLDRRREAGEFGRWPWQK